jgi:hypothetical protein
MQQGGWAGLGLTVGCLGCGIASYGLVGMRMPRYAVLYLAAGLAGLASVIL